MEKKRRPRKQSNRKSVGSDHLVVPECVFGFRDKPVCSLLGHAADVLDLSWSKSQVLICDLRLNLSIAQAHFGFFFAVILKPHSIIVHLCVVQTLLKMSVSDEF